MSNEKKRVGAPTKAERLEKERAKLEAEKEIMRWKKSADELKALKDSYDALKADYANALEKIKCFERNEAFYNTEEDTIKAVLDERAKGKPPIMIAQNLERKYIYVDLKKIEVICENITDLPMDMQEYFNERRKHIMEMRKVDDEFERTNDIDTLNMMQGKFMKFMDNHDNGDPDNLKSLLSIADRIMTLIDKKSKFNKDLNNDDVSLSSNDVREVRNAMKERNERIVKGFDPSVFSEVN